MKHELEFNQVLLKLHGWREQVVDGLRCSETHQESLRLKRQLDAAVRCLEFCQQHQIHPDFEVTVLPDTQTRTPSSNYRVLEDHESDLPEHWVELRPDNRPLHLYPGDIILS